MTPILADGSLWTDRPALVEPGLRVSGPTATTRRISRQVNDKQPEIDSRTITDACSSSDCCSLVTGLEERPATLAAQLGTGAAIRHTATSILFIARTTETGMHK